MANFDGVADTLFIPLTARVYASKRFPDFFYDEAALKLEDCIPNDSIGRNSSEYFMMASVARYHNFDRMAEAFIKRHGCCNIVNLGAGLETMALRLKKGGGSLNAKFFEVDLPEVIASRRRVLGEGGDELLIGCDMFKPDWMEKLDCELPTLFIVSGVFQYFKPERVIGLIKQMKTRFKKGELIFDSMDSGSLKKANRYVRKTGNKNAEMFFSIDDPERFAAECEAFLIEVRPFFTAARKQLKGRLKLATRIAMRYVDAGRGRIIHLGF